MNNTMNDDLRKAQNLISEEDLLRRYKAKEGKNGWWYVWDSWRECFCRNYHNELPDPEGMAKRNAAHLNKEGHKTVYPHKSN